MNDTGCARRNRKQCERFREVSEFVRARERVFSRQGTIVATWREHEGRRLGPCYRLAWREQGRQRSLYLGCSPWIAEKVRELLAALQKESGEARVLRQLEADAGALLRWSKELLKNELGRLGLSLKGFEVRGGRLAEKPFTGT